MFFCLGNICRSPLAEALFRHKVQERGLVDAFHIESSGTSSYHIGEEPDPGSQRVARERLGLDISDQRAQQLNANHVASFDYLVAMDRSNKRNAERLGSAQIMLLRELEPGGADSLDVPDPWGGGASHFERVYDIVDACTAELLDRILSEHDL
jgi:protein-tyrosine phosphatase